MALSLGHALCCAMRDWARDMSGRHVVCNQPVMPRILWNSRWSLVDSPGLSPSSLIASRIGRSGPPLFLTIASTILLQDLCTYSVPWPLPSFFAYVGGSHACVPYLHAVTESRFHEGVWHSPSRFHFSPLIFHILEWHVLRNHHW